MVDGVETVMHDGVAMLVGVGSTCLLDFGCMTAIHKCPFCRKPFDYTPHDYHAKVRRPPLPSWFSPSPTLLLPPRPPDHFF